uniref:Uncharacterized protein n=1 Tax=Chromera velia CCMP2878 TaxID=1169474 RepID=A0A0G4G7H7_9ALVE|eukprot:Cvel_4296.t1-p1 / transcript=Cvel_4296.t1 / gene=Cvel_4296 / organism=Chromera_velia_CCMP2878 / gene_product=hypothetical protein / transcript_product=hypothetical protein / location=Cvel_scaffold186:76641-77935(+) / protein_length=253 / sequence_SO=supercontig / SO=protein_coding / is_pseudo=false
MDARERGTGEDGVAFDTQEYHTPLDNLPNFMLNEVRAQKMRMNEVILAEWRAERAQKPEIDRAFKIVEKFDAEMGGTLQSQVMGMKDYVPPSIENPQHQRGLQGALSRVANRPGGVLHGGIKIVRNENGGLATRGALREGKEGVGLFAYGGPRQVRGDHERRTNRGLGSRGLFLGRSARDNKELQARASVTASPRTLQDTNAASAQAAERSEEIEMSAPGAGVGFGLDSSPSERGNTVSPPESQPLLGSSGQQ